MGSFFNVGSRFFVFLCQVNRGVNSIWRLTPSLPVAPDRLLIAPKYFSSIEGQFNQHKDRHSRAGGNPVLLSAMSLEFLLTETANYVLSKLNKLEQED